MNFSLPPISETAVLASSPAPATGSDFGELISHAISQVEATQASANRVAADFLVAGKGDVHTVALASQQAELAVEMFQQIRNKFVQAYQEIMKMPM
jgi:flagellar hook-basal body complex protein FliE